MNKSRSIQTILLLGTILAVGIIGLTNSNALVHAANGGYQAVGYDDNHDKKCNDDNDDDDDKDCKKDKYD